MSEENQTPSKQDMVDRKAAWIERMFDRLFLAVMKNPYGALLVVSVLINVWLINKVTDLQQARLDDNESSKKEMIEEVRRSVQRELPKQMAPVLEQQEVRGKAIDTSVSNFNETINEFKEIYLNKNKKK